MKPLLSIPFYFILCFTSCGQKNCKSPDYRSIKWQVIDSNTSFFICSNSKIKLLAKGSVQIEYLGTLEKGGNTVTRQNFDELFLSTLLNEQFGRFKYSDTTLPKDIRFVIKQLTQEAVATIKYSFENIKPVEPQRQIIVYFKENIDSTKASKWIAAFKTKPFVDSTYYLSKKVAARHFSAAGDSTWRSFLKDNPMPTSVDIFVKRDLFNVSSLPELKVEIMKSEIVSDVSFSGMKTDEDSKAFNQMLGKTYLISVKQSDS